MRRLRRAARMLPALLLAGSLVAACSSARISQGTSDESCYLALPTAEDAVHTHTHLEGVRRFTVAGLKGPAPLLYARFKDELPGKQALCLVAYTGHFDAKDVSKAFGRSSGSLAVVGVKTPGNELLGTLILAHLPVRFQHTHLF